MNIFHVFSICPHTEGGMVSSAHGLFAIESSQFRYRLTAQRYRDTANLLDFLEDL